MKYIFLSLMSVFITLTLFSQTKVPAAAEKAFSAKFPKAESVKWDKENDHEYEAEFELNGEESSANFSEAGEWLETETEIKFSDLPASVQSSFKKDHSGLKAKEVSKVETSDGKTMYEIITKIDKKKVEFVYDSDGKEVKK